MKKRRPKRKPETFDGWVDPWKWDKRNLLSRPMEIELSPTEGFVPVRVTRKKVKP